MRELIPNEFSRLTTSHRSYLMPKKPTTMENSFGETLRLNPADQATLSAYADWLAEKRRDRAAALQRRNASAHSTHPMQ
jgi:uncharacterized protein (TIGR02996 family)